MAVEGLVDTVTVATEDEISQTVVAEADAGDEDVVGEKMMVGEVLDKASVEIDVVDVGGIETGVVCGVDVVRGGIDVDDVEAGDTTIGVVDVVAATEESAGVVEAAEIVVVEVVCKVVVWSVVVFLSLSLSLFLFLLLLLLSSSSSLCFFLSLSPSLVSFSPRATSARGRVRPPSSLIRGTVCRRLLRRSLRHGE